MQFRLSEALIVLCWFEPVLGVGVTLGCFLANIFSTVTALDMIIGTLATGVACLITPHIKNPWLMPLPNILSNAILVGGMLAYVIFPENLLTGFLIAFAQVGLRRAGGHVCAGHAPALCPAQNRLPCKASQIRQRCAITSCKVPMKRR